MMSSEGTDIYREKVDERPIRVDHGLVGERESEGSSVHGVSHEDVSEPFRGSQMHPFCALLNFTMEEGMHYRILPLVRRQSEIYVREYWVKGMIKF